MFHKDICRFWISILAIYVLDFKTCNTLRTKKRFIETDISRDVEDYKNLLLSLQGTMDLNDLRMLIQERMRNRKTIQCYQCHYAPPKVTTRLMRVSPSGKDSGVTYRTVRVREEVHGGWQRCKGPFTDEQALAYGIDTADCEQNCYTRLDTRGHLLRGCYRGEFAVNPNMTNCHVQMGYLYCFCEGSKCNNEGPPPNPLTDLKTSASSSGHQVNEKYQFEIRKQETVHTVISKEDGGHEKEIGKEEDEKDSGNEEDSLPIE